MSHHHKYQGYMGHNPLNLYTIIILILIVLQWFRVGGLGGAAVGVPGVPGPSPEPNLTTNGGLFIIAIFLLLACSCFKGGYKRCGC